MDFKSEQAKLFARILALLSLFMGLSAAMRLLGMGSGVNSPLAALGIAGFVVLAILCVSRLFAAVGLWMHARWGALLLAGSLLAEVGLHLFRSDWVTISLTGFIFKTVLLLATILLLVHVQLVAHRQVAD